MTNEQKLNKAVSERIDIHSILQKESTQIQILFEWRETEKAKLCMKWLLSIADERKNKKLYDSITLLSKRLEKHSKLINDLQHYESKANYYEMLYKNQRSSEVQIKVMEDLLKKIQQEKF